MIKKIKNISKHIISLMLAIIMLFSCNLIVSEAAESPIVLDLVEETDRYIKFTWTGVDKIAGFKSLSFYVGPTLTDMKEQVTISLAKVDYYLMNKPTSEGPDDTGLRYYKIVVKTQSSKSYESNYKIYDPTLLNLKPSVPEITDITYNNVNNNLTFKWNPFNYTALDEEGAPMTMEVLDPEKIQYEMLVTRDVAVLNYAETIAKNTNYNYLIACSPTPNVDENGYGYWETTVDSSVYKIYNKSYNDYSYSSEKLYTNTVYYIRLIAKMNSNTTTLKSDPVIKAFYISTDGVLTVPSVMPKPPLKVEDTTISNVTLSWNMNWTEITKNEHYDIKGNPDSSTAWTNRMWLYDNENGTYDKYLSEDEYINDVIKPTGSKYNSENPKTADEALADPKLIIYDLSVDVDDEKYNKLPLYGIDANGGDWFIRSVEYSPDFEYEITYLEEVEVQNLLKRNKTLWKNPNADLLDYIDTYTKMNWTSYTYDNLIKGEDGKVSAVYGDGLLKSNTPYRFFIRAYRIDENGDKIKATRPSSVSATTKLDQEFVEPVPTVPTLILVDAKDISAKIKWRFNSELVYDLKISEIENIDTAETIEITTPMLTAKDAEIVDGYFFVHELKELYPETRYYLWIQAKQKIGDVKSAWSNPLTFRTTEILPTPLTPPSGIGVASEKDAITQDHITVEWTRKDEDYELDNYDGTKIIKNLSYVCEVANNIKFFDSNTIECGALDGAQGGQSSDFIIMAKNEFKAINLKSNSRYYVRIKTRITVRDTQGNRECYADSPWSIIKIFKTTSVNEYDSEYGDIDIPLAEKTETIYNGNTVRINILNDDRVINDMIEQGTYDYTFDFSNELTKYKNREAYIPVNVLETMQNRGMNIILKSKDTTINVPAKAFKNMDFAVLSRQGGVKGLVLTLNDDNNIYTQSVISKDIGAYFTTKYGDSATTYLEDYINVLFDTKDAVFSSKNKAKGVVYDSKTKTWKDADSYTMGYNLILKTGKTGKVGISY